MIDFATYSKLHHEQPKKRAKASTKEQEDIAEGDKDMMRREKPPSDEMINLFPSVSVGFNLRLKKWSSSSLV